jgi:apolipoprotein N-acyltransferase
MKITHGRVSIDDREARISAMSMGEQVMANMAGAPEKGGAALPDDDVPSVVFRFSAITIGLATAGLLWLCHFPMAWGWLAWVALVPLLSLVRREAPKRTIFFGSWLAGLVFFTAILQWMRVADDRMYVTWLGLAYYCSLYFPLAIGLIRFLDQRSRLPLIVTVPVVWTALEFMRGHLFTGFPWYFLAHTQHDFLALIQVSDVTGAYGVTFLVAMVNALLFDVLSRWSRFRRLFGLPEPLTGGRTLVLQSGIAAVVLIGVLGYGLWRLSQDEFQSGPVVALIQSNLPQNVRNAASGGADPAALMKSHNCKLCDHAIAQHPKPDLIVWPETSYPDYWSDIGPEIASGQLPAETAKEISESRQLGRDVARLWPTHVLMGMNSEVYGSDQRTRRYNSAILIGPTGLPQGRYDKIHRVPFGEYVPLRDWLPFMNELAPYDFDYSISVGEGFPRLSLETERRQYVIMPGMGGFKGGQQYRFGVVICYEDSDPTLARQYVRTDDGEPAVDFLINTSNDGWFKGTSEHEEHLAISRFRAIECRRSLARSVNMGISAVIDGNGRVRWPDDGYLVREDGTDYAWSKVQGYVSDATINAWLDAEAEESYWNRFMHWFGLNRFSYDKRILPVSEWHSFKKVSGVFTMAIPIDDRMSLYSRWGDWFPIGCWVLVGAALALAFWKPGTK